MDAPPNLDPYLQIATTAPYLRLSVPGLAKSVLLIGDVFRIESEQPVPNLWCRFWYWALLGWKWRRPFQNYP